MSERPGRDGEGYRRDVLGGPAIRADVIDVYVFRRAGEGAEFLQVHRARDPLRATWQPVMGHAERDETGAQCARREVQEEVGLDVGSPACLGFWALDQVHPFYVARIDAVVLSPRFACEVDGSWTPRLNEEHDAARWVSLDEAARAFLWPGQRSVIREIVEVLLPVESPARDLLAVPRA